LTNGYFGQEKEKNKNKNGCCRPVAGASFSTALPITFQPWNGMDDEKGFEFLSIR
jgi:hypothetical protein